MRVAESAPDAIVVCACTIYSQAYFGSERRMVFELFKSWRRRGENMRMRAESASERIYYRFVKEYTKREWQEKIQADLGVFLTMLKLDRSKARIRNHQPI